MMQTSTMASVNSGLYTGLSADEMISYSSDPMLDQFYSNSLIPSNSSVTGYWRDAYLFIYGSNAIIDGLADNNSVSGPVKQQLTGEAKFIRAFCYFYLVNLFGDVPLILTTDYSKNSVATRSSRNLVFDQIVIDLSEAQTELSDHFLKADNTTTNERLRPTKWAAAALLARVHLYSGNWEAAIANSTLVINQSGLFNLVLNLDSVFLANSMEAIWQLSPVTTYDLATLDGYTYILTNIPSGALGVSLSDQLVNAFEPGDLRRLHWINSINASGTTYYYAYKYKLANSVTPDEYYMVFRLSEQYLIRAEARAMTGDLDGAKSDLNIIRNKAGLANTTAVDQSSLIQAIQKERKFELFSEWGHRWLDLKRTLSADAVLGPVKSPAWMSSDTLYPIPQSERQNDPNLTQNPNY
jgi:starch-binding outer membrane protein, SusD/RagB family